jgi:hypothetical protein
VKCLSTTGVEIMAMNKAPGSQGLQSNKLVRPSVQTSKGPYSVKPGYAAQLGSMKGTHLTEGRETPYSKALIAKDAIRPAAGNTVKYGNEIALNSKSAPGQGRTIMPTGTQMQHGAANPGERKPITGPDPTAAWWPSNNEARRSPVKR